MRIIFLDIDGVLASFDYLRIISHLKEKNPDKYGYAFDLRCVKNLQWILNECPDVKIVISSSWKFMKLHNLLDMWKIRELPGEIIDVTPDLLHTPIETSRGMEIDEWLSKHPEVERYVIIDDDSDMLESQLNNFIKTNPTYGLTVEDSVKVIQILIS